MRTKFLKSQLNESVDEYQPTRAEEAQTDLLILDRIFEIADKLDAPNLDTDDHLYWVNQKGPMLINLSSVQREGL